MSCVSNVASFSIFILDCHSVFSNVYHLLSVLLQFGGSDYPFGLFVCLMVFSATSNNSPAILWRSVLLVEEIGGSRENHRPVASHH